MENIKERKCEACKELVKKIEMAAFTWEIVQFEVELYRHKIKDQCQEAA